MVSSSRAAPAVEIYKAIQLAARLSFVAIAFLLLGCGSGSRLPPIGDFSITISPSSVSAQVGAAAPPVMIGVDAQNGFTGTVDIALQGLLPASPRLPLHRSQWPRARVSR